MVRVRFMVSIRVCLWSVIKVPVLTENHLSLSIGSVSVVIIDNLKHNHKFVITDTLKLMTERVIL